MEDKREQYMMMCRIKSRTVQRDVTLTIRHVNKDVEHIVFRDGKFYAASIVRNDHTWRCNGHLAPMDEYSID